ncbi:myb-related transcription factor, partner of profilin-like [Pleurodeles waltl]|uniref:myb-related transcription factor, partner of profilin-like n=1 Tax=Pleurodeles waltl TaxID=8319 RepID=UPI0037096B4B
MAHATGERAPAFTAQELEKLVDGVLRQYALLYGPPDRQVSALQKIDIWRAIAKDVRTLGVHQRLGTHCRKRWEDIRRWSRKTAEAQLGMASQRGRGARRTLTPLMSRILAVAYPDLDGRVRTSQQTQGASSGGGEEASEHEGAASHMAMAGQATESEFTSETEGEGRSTAGTRADVSDSDSSSEGSSLVVAATSVPPAPTGTAATQRTSTALPAAPQRLPRARSPRKVEKVTQLCKHIECQENYETNPSRLDPVLKAEYFVSSGKPRSEDEYRTPTECYFRPFLLPQKSPVTKGYTRGDLYQPSVVLNKRCRHSLKKDRRFIHGETAPRSTPSPASHSN